MSDAGPALMCDYSWCHTPCTCELWGHCASCEDLPWVFRRRQATQTVNGSPLSWDSTQVIPHSTGSGGSCPGQAKSGG